MSVPVKPFRQKSGFKVLLVGFIGVVAGYLPQIVDVIQFPKPWDGIVPILLGFFVAILKLVQEQLTHPSISAFDVAMKTGASVVSRSEDPIRFTSQGKVVK